MNRSEKSRCEGASRRVSRSRRGKISRIPSAAKAEFLRRFLEIFGFSVVIVGWQAATATRFLAQFGGRNNAVSSFMKTTYGELHAGNAMVQLSFSR